MKTKFDLSLETSDVYLIHKYNIQTFTAFNLQTYKNKIDFLERKKEHSTVFAY